MHEILQICVDLDQRAHEVYHQLEIACDIPELATTFGQMAKEEAVHIGWWKSLLTAWESGLLPDIAAENDLFARLAEVREAVSQIDFEHCDRLTSDDMLDLAVRLEFFMLDPLFGELVDVIEPGHRTDYRAAYQLHVMRLIDAVELHYTRPGLASLLASVLQRAYRDQQRLASLAARDPLTTLYNRRGLLSHLNQWMSWSARYDHPIGVALLDIDHFKSINDQRGHASGDAALLAVAGALEATIRSSDVAGRFGGDEFLVLAPEADGEVLAQLIDRLVEAVRALKITDAAGAFSVSVSAGGAWAPGGRMVSPDALIAQADRSMYDVKNSGRGRAGIVTEMLALA